MDFTSQVVNTPSSAAIMVVPWSNFSIPVTWRCAKTEQKVGSQMCQGQPTGSLTRWADRTAVDEVSSAGCCLIARFQVNSDWNSQEHPTRIPVGNANLGPTYIDAFLSKGFIQIRSRLRCIPIWSKEFTEIYSITIHGMSGSANLLLGCSGWSQHERLVVRCFGWGWHGVVLCSGWFGNTTQDRVRRVDVGGGSWCCNPKFLILSSDDISCMHRLRKKKMMGEVKLSLLGGQNDLWLHCQCDIAVDKILLWNGVESWRFMCPVSFQQLSLKLLNSRFESFSLTNNNEIQQTLSKDIASQHFWLRDAVGWSLCV